MSYGQLRAIVAAAIENAGASGSTGRATATQYLASLVEAVAP
jgi:hypothetical protein